MNEIMAAFVIFEFAVGVFMTLRLVMKKIVFPTIDNIIDFWSSYGEFKEWRKRNG